MFILFFKKALFFLRNIIAANNLYDAEYIRYFTGIKAIVIPSLCTYPIVSYEKRTSKRFIIAHIYKKDFAAWFKSNLTSSLQRLKASVTVAHLREAYKDRYYYAQITRHPGIIYVPYQVSLMSLFEHYRMNIPLFFPSLDLLTDWDYTYRVVTEFDRNAIRYWLQFSDFYQWPHITYFNSIDDLAIKLITTNLPEVSRNMKKYNANVKKTLHEQWRQILERIN